MPPDMNETGMLFTLITRAPFAIPGIHIERRAIINAETTRGFRVRNGIVGQADSFAVYRGLHIELETKAARGAMADAQKRWRERCLQPPQGGPPLCPHLVLKAQPLETSDETVNRWIEELSMTIGAT